MNQANQFAEDTKNLLDQPLVPEAPAPAGEGSTGQAPVVEEDEEAKNRRERRLKERLQAERESNIALNARLQAIAEAGNAARSGEASEYEKLVEQLFGNDTPEKAAATSLLKEAFKKVGEQSTARALELMREERKKEQEAIAESEKRLDSMIDTIEDENNITMTADQKKAYFALLEKMSPKDPSGSIIEYADPHAVYEVFKERIEKQTAGGSRAKDLASTGLTPSGSAPQGSSPQDDAMKRALREAGII